MTIYCAFVRHVVVCNRGIPSHRGSGLGDVGANIT